MRRAVIALVVAAVLVILIVAQLVLPGIAARHLRSDLERHGTGVYVEVSAFPAVKLLWHHADKVTVDVADYRSGGSRSGTSLANLLARTKAVGKLDVHVGVLDERLLKMHDVTLHKNGDTLIGQVRLARGEVDDALPPKLHLAGHSLTDNQLTVAGRTSVFGRRLAARARIVLDNGRIVLQPDGLPLASLVKVTLFSDPRISVDALSARTASDGFTVNARGHLR
jgi:hypothetical protein